jgi:hypothetical protein
MQPLARMFLEAVGARPAPDRRTTGTQLVFDRAVGGFVAREMPQRVLMFDETTGRHEVQEVYWREDLQAYIPADQAAPPAAAGPKFDPAEEARRNRVREP